MSNWIYDEYKHCGVVGFLWKNFFLIKLPYCFIMVSKYSKVFHNYFLHNNLIFLIKNDVRAERSEFDIENGMLIRFYGSCGDVTIPDGVTAIGAISFRKNGSNSVR